MSPALVSVQVFRDLSNIIFAGYTISDTNYISYMGGLNYTTGNWSFGYISKGAIMSMTENFTLFMAAA